MILRKRKSQLRHTIRKKAKPGLYQIRLTGSKQMKEFEADLSESFQNTIQKTEVTIKEVKKKVKGEML